MKESILSQNYHQIGNEKVSFNINCNQKVKIKKYPFIFLGKNPDSLILNWKEF